MILHRNFTEATSLTDSKKILAKREELRKRVEEFIRDEISEEDVISITETAISFKGGLFSVTLWYRE